MPTKSVTSGFAAEMQMAALTAPAQPDNEVDGFGGAKGSKRGTVYLRAAVGRSIRRCVVTRDGRTDDRGAAGIERRQQRLTRDALRYVVGRLGDAADFKNAYSHLRHMVVSDAWATQSARRRACSSGMALPSAQAAS